MEKVTASTVVREEVRECEGATLCYRLTVEESERVASFGLSLYSVAVTMEREGARTESALCNCFSQSEEAFRFFDLAVGHLVTPIDLPYVYADVCKN